MPDSAKFPPYALCAVAAVALSAAAVFRVSFHDENHAVVAAIDPTTVELDAIDPIDVALLESESDIPRMGALTRNPALSIDERLAGAGGRESNRVRSLRALRVRYQELANAGGWPTIPGGETVQPGEQDPRLPAVRARLAMTKDLAEASESDLLDSDVVAAIARFQTRVQLPPSGALDAATLRALNVPAQERLMSVELSLGRALTLPQRADQDHVVVNIAGFNAQYMRGDQELWSGRTMVGKTSTRTPQLVSAIDRLVFNPTWIVPNGIANRTVLPAIIKDPNYMAKKKLRVFDKSWQEVNPKSVDWKAYYKSRSRHLFIRQDAGDHNVLGKVKFLFPNRYSVYLHDTSSKHLFDEDSRAFSNGCVRIQNPMELAAAMLNAQGWDGDGMRDAANANTRPKVVHLDQPIPVHTVYLTAEMGENGQAIFHPDVYDENTEQAYASL